MAKANTDTILALPYRDRMKLVQERIKSLQRYSFKPLPKPARVAAAEKLVREWEDKNEVHDRQQRSEHRQKLNAITDALIVGDMQKAVTLMQRLEA
jgi:hypothetical protein